jgi:glycerate 2-kinase
MTPRPAVPPDPRAAPTDFLRHLFDVAVARAQPMLQLPAFVPEPPTAPGARTLVLGAGKAAGAMAHALEACWPNEAPLEGLVITRYGHTPPRPERLAGRPPRIEIVEAAHPVPDEAGLAATARLLALTRGLTADDLVIFLVSGGGSALLVQPAPGVTFAEKQRINRELLDSGAQIGEMNCVRKHLSAIKGGRLAQACAPAAVVTLAISDVPGDDPAVIASGPTVPDPTTCADALAVLDRYRIAVPHALREALQQGRLETPKPDDAVFVRSHCQLIAAPQQSLEAAADAARAAGLNAYVLSDEVEGESREVGRVHAALARAAARGQGPFVRPCLILSGGETTVTVRQRAPGQARGRGGRAGEFCMGLAQALQGQAGVWALAADTDGIDGLETNAGAWVGPDTLARARQAQVSLADHLDRNDAYGFFESIGGLVVTGPTHTNVNDFRALLVL